MNILFNKANSLIAILSVLVIGGGLYLLASDQEGKGTATIQASLNLSEPVEVTPKGALFTQIAHYSKKDTTYLTYVEVAGEDKKNIFLKSSADSGKTWSQPVRVNDQEGDVGSIDSSPQNLVIGPDGSVNLLWYAKDNSDKRYEYGRGELRFTRSVDAGKTFSPTVAIAAKPGSSNEFHNLTVTADGTIHVGFLHSENFDSETRQIQYTSSKDEGRTWADAVSIDDAACECCRASLAADGEDIYVGWRKIYQNGDQPTIRDSVLAHSDDSGKTWSQPVKFHDDDWAMAGCPHAGPSLAFDAKGVLHGLWYHGKEKTGGVYHAVSSDKGKTWSQPTAVFTADFVPVTEPEMFIDFSDNVWITYEDKRDLSGKTNTQHGEHGPDKDGPSKIRVARITTEGSLDTFSDVNMDGGAASFAELRDSLAMVWSGKDGVGYFVTYTP